MEEKFANTRRLLEELQDSGADILICTKSDLVLRDLELLKKMNGDNKLTVSWSINTLDENFRKDMDEAVSIERRIGAMKKVYDVGIRIVCFISPFFPGITDFEAPLRAKDPVFGNIFWAYALPDITTPIKFAFSIARRTVSFFR